MHQRITRILATLLCLSLLFVIAGCSKEEESSTPESFSISSEPSSVPEDEDPADDFDVTTSAFLTGLQKTSDYPEGQRIAAVMVGNNRGAWPHNGLSDASIVLEAIVESFYITRLCAIYEDYTTMPMVAPVRSARDQFFQVIAPFQPFYVHDGPAESTSPVNMLIDQMDENAFNLCIQRGYKASSYGRPGFGSPYNEYTDGDQIMAAIENNNLDANRQYNSPIFSFVPYDKEQKVPSDGSINSFIVTHSAQNLTGFDYNGDQYVVSMNNGGAMQMLTDGNNGETLAFDNVLVLFAPMQLYANSELVQVDFYGGAGFYFSNGGWETLRWNKGPVEYPLQLTEFDDPETTFQLNPGTTYICLVRDSELESFDTSIRSGASDAGDNIPDAQDVDD